MSNLPEHSYSQKQKEAVAQLTGIAGALIYDGELNDSEIEFLQIWLRDNSDFRDRYPISDFYTLMQKIFDDNRATKGEKKVLYDFLLSIASIKSLNPTVDGIYSTYTEIEFAGKGFMFTGDLIWGPRDRAGYAVQEKGGFVVKSTRPTLKTDYLVVGDLGSEAWKHSRFGTKIIAARAMQKEGHRIKILQESDFVNALI